MPDSVAPERAPVREIETSPVPQRFARGWHCLGLAAAFKNGQPHGVEAFGTRLVVFQSSDGRLNVLSAHCLHLGGDLASGRIVGDTVACPFHDWRWAGDGRCALVPYGRRTPDVSTRSWPSWEINGHLIVWNDPERNPPPDDVTVPRLEFYGTEAWSDWSWCDAIIDNHPRELIDNLADMAHFFYVHGERKAGMPGYFKTVFERQTATQYLESGSDDVTPTYPRDQPYTGDPEAIDGYLRSESTWNGPAYSIDHLWWRFTDGVIQSVLFLGILPIRPDRFRLSMGVLTRHAAHLGAAENARRAEQNFEMLRAATFQDVAIWRTKARIDNPMLSESDGPVYRLRQWYDQFYVDALDVKPGSVARFEREVDTRYANEVWARELAGIDPQI